VIVAVGASLFWKAPWPMGLLLLIPLGLFENRWAFLYAGPTIRWQWVLLGRPMRTKTWVLGPGDDVSTEKVEDSVLYSARPRWYKLKLWLSAKSGTATLMRSNQIEDLNRMSELMNAAIDEVRSRAAS